MDSNLLFLISKFKTWLIKLFYYIIIIIKNNLDYMIQNSTNIFNVWEKQARENVAMARTDLEEPRLEVWPKKSSMRIYLFNERVD